jgi:preprotein translocase subunit YajC
VLILTLLQAQAPVGPNPFGTVFMFGAIFLIFYFLLIRPQRKQQKAHDEMVKALTRGDEVVTIGGIIGRIIHLTDDRVTIKTAEDTRLEVERSKIGRRSGSAQGES